MKKLLSLCFTTLNNTNMIQITQIYLYYLNWQQIYKFCCSQAASWSYIFKCWEQRCFSMYGKNIINLFL